MTPDEQKLDSEIRVALQEDRDSMANVRNEMNKHLGEVRIQVISQKRELLKHISLISAAILGLMTITANNEIIKSYFIIGAALHMVVIVLVLSYLREHIDKDGAGLQEQQDKYNEVSQVKIDLADEYLSKVQLVKQDVSEYFQRLHSSPLTQRLLDDNNELAQQRKNRKNQVLDYFNEMVVFMFICASALVFVSFINHHLIIWEIGVATLVFALISFSDSATFLTKYISRLATFLKLLPKREIELRKIDQVTIGDIIDDEASFIIEAEKRYGLFFKNAADFNALLQDFIKEVNVEGWIFVMFISQVRKYHTLALFSAARRHHIQVQMNLRQTIEAGVNAAHGLANPNVEDFVVKDERGIVDTPQSLTEKRYNWLENNYRDHSDFLKKQKGLINGTIHSNMVYAFLNFNLNAEAKKGFETPFFDIEDKYLIQTDLWFIGNLAMGLMDLFLGINLKYKKITFKDGFVERLKELERQNHKLKEEMTRHPRYKNALVTEESTKERGQQRKG